VPLEAAGPDRRELPVATRTSEEMGAGRTGLIKVVVTFPVSKKGPFSEEVAPETAVGTVRTAAMNWFGLTDDAQFTYALTHGGLDQANETTVGDIAGKAHAVEFRLVKKITQG
jgi:hypothetical protein